MECDAAHGRATASRGVRRTQAHARSMKHRKARSDALCPALEALISDGGQVTLGAVGSIPNAAVAAMPKGMLAALVRRPGETIPQILQRLDAALVQAVSENRVISEFEL